MRSADSFRRRLRGFTLIEVLAALVIVSLGMLAVIQAVSETARNSTYVRDKTVAHWVAMNQLTLTRLAPSPPKIDKTSDEVEMADRRWRWTMEVTQSPLESVRRIEVSVRPEDADEKSSLAFVTGFYGTAIAPPGTTAVLWQQSGNEQGDGKDDGKKDDDKKDQDPPPPAQPDPGEPVDTPVIPEPEPTE
ncbi:MAG TPA: type II secretion system minor pseudopilin GspI [Povalibacter sp.]|uniref:type II secretion system minor pseudopilin GspI n=1 Tax=Povalibacter sp. TaxID=1962978 RepID=UPI002B6C1D50|nr:type II secretion system minor pseudopilin GspI [Povalibacter sp.]HMN43296.1 type II secretion system minor pseudopilin GspI [Povalibacter sp.]